MFAATEEAARKFRASLGVNPKVAQLRKLLADLAEESDDVDSLRTRIQLESAPKYQDSSFASSARAFVTLHEAAHHLLNHTRARNKANIAPGRAYLDFRFAEYEYQINLYGNHKLSPKQIRELEADALAYLLMVGEAGNALTRHNRSLLAGSGAFTALPALELVATLPTASGALRAEGERSHPPYEVRLRQMAEVVIIFGVDHPAGSAYMPEIGRQASRHPSGLLMQQLAAADVLRASTTAALWTPKPGASTGRPRLIVPSPRAGTLW